MCAATDEINAVQILEAIVRTQVQHLIQRVRKVEGRAAINLVARVPVSGSDDTFVADTRRVEIVTRFLDLIQQQLAKARAFL